jgi:hypothetical protein
MALPYSDKLIPHHRRGCEVLLESVDYCPELLTAEQLAACRALYFLDDPRSIAELVIAEVLQP